MAKSDLGPGSRALLLLAAVVVVLAGLKLGGPVIVPLLIAACIAAATTPIVGFLKRRGLPTSLAVTGTIITVLAALVGFGVVVSIAISDFADSLPAFERALVRTKHELVHWLQINRLGRLGPTVMSYDPGTWGAHAVESAVLGAPPLIGAFGVVFFVVIFILLEAATFRDKLHRALGWRDGERFAELRHIVSEVQRYLFIKTVTSAATGVLCGLWCVVMDLPNAALWGVTAFALNFIPVFGSVIAAVPPLLAGFLQGGASTSLAVLGGYLVINNVIGNFIEPKVMGRAAGLSALVVVVSIVVWGWIFGPVGALLSVPLTMIAKIVFANVDDTQWLAVLLAPGGGKDEEEYVEARRRSRLERFPAVPPAHAPGPAE